MEWRGDEMFAARYGAKVLETWTGFSLCDADKVILSVATFSCTLNPVIPPRRIGATGYAHANHTEVTRMRSFAKYILISALAACLKLACAAELSLPECAVSLLYCEGMAE